VCAKREENLLGVPVGASSEHYGMSVRVQRL
jgi:hypothetical protein